MVVQALFWSSSWWLSACYGYYCAARCSRALVYASLILCKAASSEAGSVPKYDSSLRPSKR